MKTAMALLFLTAAITVPGAAMGWLLIWLFGVKGLAAQQLMVGFGCLLVIVPLDIWADRQL